MRRAMIGGAAVAIAAAVIMVVLGTGQYLGYDSFWHVFIARQENWDSFWREVRDNAHPPIYYLLLKVTISLLGNSFLAYRAVSILAIMASTLLFARITTQVTKNPSLAIVAAAAFGVSSTAIEIGLEVRAYALFLAFILASLSAYISWIHSQPDSASFRVRILFASALVLALLTHYSAFFFLGAAITTPAILFVSHPRWRVWLKQEIKSHSLALVIMFGVPLVVALTAYGTHVSSWAHRLNHVPSFLYDQHTESLLAFIGRTTLSLGRLFIPNFVTHHLAVVVITVTLIVGLSWLATRRFVRGHVVAVPFILLTVMIVANIVTAIIRRYPYGGLLRQEVFLFPFVLLSFFTGIECLRRIIPRRWSLNGLWVAVATMSVASNVYLWTMVFPIETEQRADGIICRNKTDRLQYHFGIPPVVLVDQFNLIRLFGGFHDWQWHIQWESNNKQRMWQVWNVSKDGQQFLVCRDAEWQEDFSQPDFYDVVAKCLYKTGVDRMVVFRSQLEVVSAQWKTTETERIATDLGAKKGIVVESMFIEGDNVYALFKTESTPRIHVVEATYGGSCRVPAGNVTSILRDSCDGLVECIYRVESSKIGDPAQNCAKDFVAVWTCDGEKSNRQIKIDPEAGLGSSISLTCTP